jgi:hypothetical protein
MSRRYAKHLPATNGWRAPNGQMAEFEPRRFESAADDDSSTVRCARCGQERQRGQRCIACEKVEP